MRCLFSLALAMILLVACRPEDPLADPPPFVEILACHENTNLDSLSLRQAMLGQWNWHYVRCQNGPDQSRTASSSITYLDISPDTIGLWPENSLDPIADATWSLERRNASLFVLGTDPLIVAPDLEGQVIVCDPWLVINRSYRNFCDIYYKKRE
ncbi:MAG: hypothetical protein AAFN10_12475 [Bacteroidota bacterium]